MSGFRQGHTQCCPPHDGEHYELMDSGHCFRFFESLARDKSRRLAEQKVRLVANGGLVRSLSEPLVLKEGK
jgi:hypothetical protein